MSFDIELAESAIGCAERQLDIESKNDPIRRYFECGREGWLCGRCRALRDAIERIKGLQSDLRLEQAHLRDWHRRAMAAEGKVDRVKRVVGE